MPNLHLFASVGNNAGSVASMAETGPRRPGSTISDARPLDTWQLRRRETGAPPPPQRAKNLSLKTRSPLTSIHARATATDATDVSAAAFQSVCVKSVKCADLFWNNRSRRRLRDQVPCLRSPMLWNAPVMIHKEVLKFSAKKAMASMCGSF